MSERTTGATDEQIEAATLRREKARGIGSRNRVRTRAYILEQAEFLVPPGMVIAPAADVLTSGQRAAMERLVIVNDVMINLMAKHSKDFTPELRKAFSADIETLRAIADGGAK